MTSKSSVTLQEPFSFLLVYHVRFESGSSIFLHHSPVEDKHKILFPSKDVFLSWCPVWNFWLPSCPRVCHVSDWSRGQLDTCQCPADSCQCPGWWTVGQMGPVDSSPEWFPEIRWEITQGGWIWSWFLNTPDQCQFWLQDNPGDTWRRSIHPENENAISNEWQLTTQGVPKCPNPYESVETWGCFVVGNPYITFVVLCITSTFKILPVSLA